MMQVPVVKNFFLFILWRKIRLPEVQINPPQNKQKKVLWRKIRLPEVQINPAILQREIQNLLKDG